MENNFLSIQLKLCYFLASRLYYEFILTTSAHFTTPFWIFLAKLIFLIVVSMQLIGCA